MRSLVTVLATAALGCQVYDFEKVVPLAIAQTAQAKDVVARKPKPNLMLLVDRSGSMKSPINPAEPRCTPVGCGPGNPCAPTCPTRETEMKTAMASFLANSGTVARMGLTFFPHSSDGCFAPTEIDVDLPAPSPTDDDATMRAKAMAISSKISTAVMNGGTPTGNSLAFVGTVAGLNDANDFREDLILLLTDGLPNCNDANANNTCSVANPACKCTLGPLSACQNAGSTAFQPCSHGCLDAIGTTEKIQALRMKNIRTVVVGFGADTASGDAADTLNLMAEAGGFARSGTPKFYRAANGMELSAALDEISRRIGDADPCKFPLTVEPSDPRFLSVIINGESVASGPDTWAYVPPSTGMTAAVAAQGKLCQDINVADTRNPIKVQIRILQKL